MGAADRLPGPPGCQDQSFGPFAGYHCRGGMDFTLRFEESILVIPLQCILLAILPFRLMKLAKTESKVRWGILQPFKLIAALCLVGLNAGILALWSTVSTDVIIRTKTTVAANALSFIASIAILLLSWLEHERSLRPSFIIFSYLFLSVLVDVARVRTTWLLTDDTTIPGILTFSYVVRVIMVVLESIEKRGSIKFRFKLSYEITASTISRATFVWLLPLFKLGYKKTLSLEDLYPLDERLDVDTTYPALSEAWAKVPNQEAPNSLFKTWLGTFGKSLLGPVFPRLCVTALTYTQPMLIKQTIIFAALPRDPLFDNWGYGLIGAFILVYFSQAIAQSQYTWRLRRTSAKIRSSLFGLIYEKSLRLDIVSPNVTPTAGLTLLGTDTETVITGMNMFHEFWASLLEIAIATWLISRELGAACAMPIAVSVICVIASIFIAVPMGKAQAAWIGASGERVSATTKTLGGIKRLKISGLSNMAFSVIKNLRNVEMVASRKFRALLGGTLIMIILVPLWSPILTFSTWAGVARNHDGTLSLGKVFASYLYISLLASPLSSLLITFPALIGSMVCFGRIQAHLNGKERKDNRNQPYTEPMMKDKLDTLSGSEQETILTDMNTTPSPLPPLPPHIIANIQGRFRWEEEGEPVFDVHDFNVERGALTFLIGPVGCGKSTLVKGLLGELAALEGSVRTNFSGVAYCDQHPWIPNETVRNIITGYSQVDESWYQKVSTVCALNKDIENWQDGDNTEAGTSGISLSGGQKQRLSIARALYAKREFMIFDDVLSGLDAATENKVFTQVFGPDGILRQGNMSALVVTSSSARFSYADRIIVLDEKGQIKHEGTPAELQDVLKIGETELGWEAHVDDDAPKKEKPADTQEKVTAKILEAVKPKTLEEQDESRRTGDSAMYMFYARAAGRHLLLMLSISMAVYAFCQSFPTLWISWWGAAKNPLDNLGKWIGVYVALGAGATISIGIGLYQLLILVITRAGIKFHDDMVDTVSGAPMSFHTTVDSGVTVNRFSQDLRLIDMELPQALFTVMTTVAGGVAQFILVCVSAKYMAAFLPFLGVILYIIQFVYLRTSRQLRLLDIECTAPLYTQLIETLNGLPTIRAFQWEDQLAQKNRRLINNSLKPYYLLASVQSWLNFVTDCFVAVIAVIFAVLATMLRKQIGAGLVGTGLSNILSFSTSMKAFIKNWVILETALGAVSRVRKFMAATPVEGFQDDNIREPPADEKWPSVGAITIKNVTASYPNSGPVLKNISLNIFPGERIAVCGRTGSGKSSFTLALLKMIQQDGGDVLIDGVNLKNLPHEYVREHLVALPQDSYIFDGTVRLNVDPKGKATDDQIIDVLQKVHLWDKVESRGGLDTKINDDFFSLGESQLLVFARAMLRDSKILILDEFTSSLDDDAGAIVEELMNTNFQDWTVIAVAHKLDSIVNFDRVAVMDAGVFAEIGNPQELLQHSDSIFAEMFNAKYKK